MDQTTAAAQIADDQRLRGWLSQMYQAHCLGVGDPAVVTRLARSAVQADSRLTEAAKRRLAELEPVCARRDKRTAFLEHKQLEYAKQLLQTEEFLVKDYLTSESSWSA
jgi:hypothetical protein